MKQVPARNSAVGVARPLTLRAVVGASLLGLGGGLAACDSCANVDCVPCSSYYSDVAVALAADSAQQGFRQAELRGAYVVRYRRPGFGQARDTVRRPAAPNPSTGFGRHGFYLGGLQWPRTGATGPQADTLTRYNYRVVLPALGRHYDLSELELGSRINTDGSCCNCPENERRRLLLNGQLVVADGVGERQVVLQR